MASLSIIKQQSDSVMVLCVVRMALYGSTTAVDTCSNKSQAMTALPSSGGKEKENLNFMCRVALEGPGR